MNTPERNIKNAEKMSNLGKVYSDSADDLTREETHKAILEEATREYPLPTARRFAWVACGGFWVFCFGGLLFGVDLRALFPFMFLSLGAVAALHVPMFFVKRKMFDVIVAVIFTISCVGMAVSMLVR